MSKLRFIFYIFSHFIVYGAYIQTNSFTRSSLVSTPFSWFSQLYLIYNHVSQYCDITSRFIRIQYLFQMKPTRCTLLLSIFISTSLHVSGNYVPSSGETYSIYESHSNQQTKQLHIESEKYQCRTDKVSSPDDGHIFARNM